MGHRTLRKPQKNSGAFSVARLSVVPIWPVAAGMVKERIECPRQWAASWGPSPSSQNSARAGWARFIGPTTRSSVATSQSRCCPPPGCSTLIGERFDREARSLAALNHPHIGAIYGVEDVDDRRALILELVEGPTLAERLETGALSIKETLAIAVQIADALDAAHQAGIVHRDLKPANVKVRTDGQVKVLDFGIAKMIADAPSGATVAATATDAATLEGFVIGTATYMSPSRRGGLSSTNARTSGLWLRPL